MLRRGVEKTTSRLYAASWRCIRALNAHSLREKTRARARECSYTLFRVYALLSCTRFTNLTFTRRLVGSSSHVTLAAPSERAANIVQRRDGFYFRIVVVVSLFCLSLVSPARVADTLVNSTRTRSPLTVLERFDDFSMMGSTYLACETTPTRVANTVHSESFCKISKIGFSDAFGVVTSVKAIGEGNIGWERSLTPLNS